MHKSPLEELQRAMLRVCLSESAAPEDLALLGSDQTSLYREMVRSRLREALSNALPRTESAIGKARFDEAFVRYLREHGVRTRYLREVTVEFAQRLLLDLSGESRDILALELAKFRAGWISETTRGALEPFDLSKVPCPHPSLRVLHLEHAIEGGEIQTPARPVPVWVAVYRLSDGRVETRVLDRISALLLEDWARAARPAIETVRAVLESEGREADAAFVERMSALLSALVERGAIRGSLPS